MHVNDSGAIEWYSDSIGVFLQLQKDGVPICPMVGPEDFDNVRRMAREQLPGQGVCRWLEMVAA